jgi:hypothetical protein
MGPPIHLSNGRSALFPEAYSRRLLKLTSHPHLAPWIRMLALYINFPTCLHCVVLNYLSTRRTYIYSKHTSMNIQLHLTAMNLREATNREITYLKMGMVICLQIPTVF